jgi:hypothetical protein
VLEIDDHEVEARLCRDLDRFGRRELDERPHQAAGRQSLTQEND